MNKEEKIHICYSAYEVPIIYAYIICVYYTTINICIFLVYYMSINICIFHVYYMSINMWHLLVYKIVVT